MSTEFEIQGKVVYGDECNLTLGTFRNIPLISLQSKLGTQEGRFTPDQYIAIGERMIELGERLKVIAMMKRVAEQNYSHGRTGGFLAGKFAGASQVITQILTFIDDSELRAKIIDTMPKLKGWPETLAVWTDEDRRAVQQNSSSRKG